MLQCMGSQRVNTIWQLNRKVLNAEQTLLGKTAVQPGISDEKFEVRNFSVQE